ncbi:MAG: hypothetical protein JJT75_11785 [Opitutales bacterium]|nr:hypothetical protein [Opitutales bacterium]MCH8539744.1 hypothetical protein [Opitutales bacterium]
MKSEIASPVGDACTEEEIAAWIAAQPIPRTLNLGAVVYGLSDLYIRRRSRLWSAATCWHFL